jgi:ABC-type nitrate/sulfonate/bicarbonate transport system substrate-binding protein
VFLLLAITCVGNLAQSSAQAQSKVTSVLLELTGAIDVAAAGAVVAKSAGLFTREGLEVKIRSVPSEDPLPYTDDQTAVVINVLDASQLLSLRAKGTPLVALAANSLDSTVLFYFRRDRKIQSPADIEDKSVQYDAGLDTGLVFEWFLLKTPIVRSRITEISQPANVKALIDNKIDVLVGHAGVESISLMENRIDFGTLDPRRYGVHTLGTVYAANEKAVRNDAETIIRFLKALIGGWDMVYSDIERSLPIIEAALAPPQSSSASVRFALQQQREFLRPNGSRFGEFSRKRWIDLQEFMLRRRLLKAPLSLRESLDFGLLAEAHRRQ